MLGEWFFGGRGKRVGDRERGCPVSVFFWGGRGMRGGDRDRGCSVSGWGGRGKRGGDREREREVARYVDEEWMVALLT